MATLLTDEVWQTLDRDAGRMSRRTFGTLLASAAIVGVLAAAGFVGWRSGLLWPNVVRPETHASWGIDVQTHTFDITFPVRNDGLVPVDITGVGRSGTGLTLTRSAINESHLGAGDTTEIALSYQVTDCAAVQSGSWPVPLHVSRGRTAYVQAPEMTLNAPGSYSYSGGRDPYAVEWQVKLAGIACGLIPVNAS
jgi:hypothetical protein